MVTNTADKANIADNAAPRRAFLTRVRKFFKANTADKAADKANTAEKAEDKATDKAKTADKANTADKATYI